MKLLWVLTLLAISCRDGQRGTDKIFVYFLPFEMTTYSPTTENNIESTALATVILTSDSPAARELEDAVSSKGNGQLDGNHIRMKVVWPGGHTLFVDSRGGAKAAGAYFQLDSGQLRRIERLVNEKRTQRYPWE
jgi:hypothetical protein